MIQRNKCGGIRYCDTCELIKPDRCHHCSICDRYAPPVQLSTVCSRMYALSFVVCRCVLKMDHHCPWSVWLVLLFLLFDKQSLVDCSFSVRVNNCVGYSNYKYFVLFLFYTLVLCAWFSLTGLYDFIRAWVSEC